jgi:hypothetical protein
VGSEKSGSPITDRKDVTVTVEYQDGSPDVIPAASSLQPEPTPPVAVSSKQGEQRCYQTFPGLAGRHVQAVIPQRPPAAAVNEFQNPA